MFQMAKIVPILSASVEDIMVCGVMHYVRAANGCCRAKAQETSTNENMEGDQRVLSAVHRKTDRRALARAASICVCDRNRND